MKDQQRKAGSRQGWDNINLYKVNFDDGKRTCSGI